MKKKSKRFKEILKTATIDKKKDLKEITREIMKEAKACALITMDSLGIAHARAMDPFLPEEDFTVWMATNPKSLKVQQLKNNKKVTLYYFDKALEVNTDIVVRETIPL